VYATIKNDLVVEGHHIMNANRKKTRTITVTEHAESSEDEGCLPSADQEDSVESAFDAAKQTLVNFEEMRADCIGETKSCPLCQFGFRPDSAHTKDIVLKRMFQIYNKNMGTMPPEEIAALIVPVYDAEYRVKELKKGNIDVLVLTVSSTIRHLRFHMFSYRKTLDDSIQDMVFMEGVMKNANFMIVGGNKKIPVKQNFSLYLNLLKEKRSYVTAASSLKNAEKS
jgi:phosphotransferase system IIB component